MYIRVDISISYPSIRFTCSQLTASCLRLPPASEASNSNGCSVVVFSSAKQVQLKVSVSSI